MHLIAWTLTWLDDSAEATIRAIMAAAPWPRGERNEGTGRPAEADVVMPQARAPARSRLMDFGATGRITRCR